MDDGLGSRDGGMAVLARSGGKFHQDPDMKFIPMIFGRQLLAAIQAI